MMPILSVVRILQQKIQNKQRATCKFCTPFSWILHTVSSLFFHFKIICFANCI